MNFVDSNIWIYGHDSSAGVKQVRAQELLAELRGGRSLATSIQVLQEFFVNVTTKARPAIPAAEAATAIRDMATNRLHRPNAGDVLGAIGIQERVALSFWDAMIVRSASALGCEVLWTEDLAHGETYEGVEVRNPFV